MAGHGIDSLLRMQGRSFRPLSLPPSIFTLYVYIYTCITLHPTFFFLLRLASLPINILSASYPRSFFSFPPRYPLSQRTNLPLSPSFPFPSTTPSYLLHDLTCFYPAPSLSTYNITVSFSISLILYETGSVSLTHPHRAERRGRKGMTRRTGLSNPLPRNDKTPVEG